MGIQLRRTLISVISHLRAIPSANPAGPSLRTKRMLSLPTETRLVPSESRAISILE